MIDRGPLPPADYKCQGGPPFNYAEPQPGCCDVPMKPDMAAGAFPHGSYPSLLGPGYRLIDTIYFTNSIYGTYYTSVLNGGSCGFTACVDPPTRARCELSVPPPSATRVVIGAPAAHTPLGGPDFFGDRWVWHDHGTPLYYPLIVRPGCTIDGVHHRIIKLSDSSTTMTLRLVKVVDGANALLGSSSVTAPGTSTISIGGPHLVASDAEYQVQVDKTAGPPGDDQSLWAAFDATCP